MEPRYPLSFTRELKLGQGLSRSSPCLVSNLRQYGLDRGHLGKDRPCSASRLQPLDESDLIGGNGRWRQRKAEAEFARRAVEEAEQQRQMKLLQEEKRRRKAAIEAHRRQQIENSKRQAEEEKERQRQDREFKEQQRREKEERERQRREEEEREWLRRQPQTCETCGGAKACTKCLGKGYLFDVFLVSSVTMKKAPPWTPPTAATLMDYGKAMQGCEECGGYRHNICGELKYGTGNCAACKGVGKIKPNIEPLLPARRRVVSSGLNLLSPGSPSAVTEDGSPLSLSPTSNAGGG